ncbi:MAG: hypothetical protein ACRENE_34015 [Polyangiaceae bacterium]
MTTTTVTQVNIATQKADIGAQYTALVSALGSQLPDVTSFLMGNTTYTKDDLVARFKAFLAAIDATRSAQTTLHTSVARERDLRKQVAPLRSQLKTFLGLRFGKNSPEMQKFGFTQAKVPKTPVASKAEGIAKSQATRAARGTKGKKQKSQIKAPTAAQPVAAAPPVAAAIPATSVAAAPVVSGSTAIAKPAS